MSWQDFWKDFGDSFKDIWNDGYQVGDVLKTIGTPWQYPVERIKQAVGIPTVAPMDNISTATGSSNTLSENANDSYKDMMDYQAEINNASAQRAMDFEAEQAQLNRDFQERLSNTQYQRAFADMQAAGLNPMLMLNQLGGASTPTGSTASGYAASVSGSGNAMTGLDAAKNIATTAFSLALLFKVFKQFRALAY